MKLLSTSSAFWSALVASACLALAACSGASNGIGGSQGDAGTDSGSQNCVTSGCGNGQSYQVCTSPPQGGCVTETYSVGSQSFQCNSCMSNCTQVAEQAVMACLNGGGGDGGVDAGNTSCSAAMGCGASGDTYQECTTIDNQGGCLSIDYKTGDGRNFTCPGCQNCVSIAQNLQSYCSTNPSPDAGTGSTACSAGVSCGSTGYTYGECTTTGPGGTCESIAYKISNGVTYTCASCSDCTSAVESLDAFCAGGAPTTNCTSWAVCGTSSLEYEQCTVSENGTCQSIYYQTSDSQTYTCNSCSDCSTALADMESYCDSQSTPVTSCGAYSACGSTGVEYQLCTTTTGGACTGEYYQTTDSNTFTCSGCDCTTASTQLSTYCASLTGVSCNGTTCAAGDLCCLCDSTTYECLSSNGGTYTCASPYGCE